MRVRSVWLHGQKCYYGRGFHIKGIDVDSMKEILSIDTSHFVDRISVSDDGETLFVSYIAMRVFDVWCAKTGELKRSLECRGSRSIEEIARAGPDEVVVGCSGGDIQRWDWRRGEHVATCNPHLSSVLELAFSGKHKQVFSRSLDGTAMAWDIRDNAGKVIVQDTRGKISGICLIDSETVATSHSNGNINMWDAETLKLKGRIRNDSGVTALAVSFNKRFLAYAQEDKVMKIVDLATELRYKIKLREKARTIAISSYGRTFAVWFSDCQFSIMAINPGLCEIASKSIDEKKLEVDGPVYTFLQMGPSTESMA